MPGLQGHLQGNSMNVIDRLDICPGHSVLDLGCGSGPHVLVADRIAYVLKSLFSQPRLSIYHSLLVVNGLYYFLTGSQLANPLLQNEHWAFYVPRNRFEQAIAKAGFKAGRGEQVAIALDPAASELYDEETKTYNLGFDFSIINNRLSGALDLYQRNTSDLLNRIPVRMFFTGRSRNFQRYDRTR